MRDPVHGGGPKGPRALDPGSNGGLDLAARPSPTALRTGKQEATPHESEWALPS